ncbi:hypothetical protein GUJ93_ZPchr0008g13925 [Zizania palustris]|uniref:OBG-type G domain-containing protein n=1 Tax=Zizania palustris TaxID=103762 RepID=A0A8J5RWB1_ZIZPA|nr:hypothetical protein GUJ93_ZPchr0008g13925 [Zizania palustris]
MTTFVPTTEDMQVLADLQQAIANLRTYLGLTPVASMLPSFPYGVTGFPSAPSPPSPHVEAERKDREVLNPVLIKEVVDQQDQLAIVELSADEGALVASKHAVEAALAAPSMLLPTRSSCFGPPRYHPGFSPSRRIKGSSPPRPLHSTVVELGECGMPLGITTLPISTCTGLSLTKHEAEERLSEGRKKLEEAFQLGKWVIDDLLNIAKTLRSMPVVDPHIPTLCLVGSPNVGKSSLVRILSTGKPEVCSYPFTTRGILMGHIVSNHERFQVTDTPGLLTRDDDERNNIERLTLAVLSHLPIAVLYVHDLSEDCGTSVADQFITYKHIRERFNDRLWIDVISKSDLLDKNASSKLEDADDEVERYTRFGPEGAIQVSVTGEIGIKELKERVQQLLTSQMARIKVETIDQETQRTEDTRQT